jgi:hypothetical protein
MIWLKRRCHAAEFEPFQTLLENLMATMPTRTAEFLMVSTNAEDPLDQDCFIGLPEEVFAAKFHGFAKVSEDELPKEIDDF